MRNLKQFSPRRPKMNMPSTMKAAEHHRIGFSLRKVIVLFISAVLFSAFYTTEGSAQSVSLSTNAVEIGQTVILSWSSFSGNVNLEVWKGNTFWVYANTNVAGTGSQNLVTTGWELRSDYWVKVVLRSNTSVYRSTGYFSVSQPSLSISATSVTQGQTVVASWSGFSGTINLEVWKGNTFWTYANTNIAGSGSQNLVTTGWEIRSDYRVKVVLRSNANIYRYSNYLSVQAPLAAPVITSFSINNGASSTTNRTVTLNNSCTGSPTYYMASENSSFSGASWFTYSNAPNFTLSSGNGTKTVYFKVKNNAGESSVSSYQIVLNESNSLSITSFSINNNASSTTNRTVTLNNTCTGSPTHYMASENFSFSCASWLTYSGAPSFALSSGNGTKTVYFKVKNSTAESSVLSDQIVLNESISQPTDRYVFPVVGYLNSICFDWGAVNSNFGNKKHVAQDVKCGLPGTQVYSASTGTVKFAQARGTVCDNWGDVLVIEHTQSNGSKLCFIYGHIASSVQEGATVVSGQSIGTIKDYSPSCSWSDHLHFGIYNGAFGVSQGTYPCWLAGYLLPDDFPGSYLKPDVFIQNAAAAIQVTSPTSGQQLVKGTTYTVTWTSEGIVGNVQIDLYKGGRAILQLSANDPNDGSMPFNPPLTLTDGNDYQIGISAMNGLVWDFSDNFSIISSSPLPTIANFSINNGASSTATRTVTLNNSCTGNPTHYIASENSSFSGASWQPYSTAPAFTLSTGNGTKRVYFKVKNNGGESSVVSDDILLSETSQVVTIWSESFETNSVPGSFWNATDANIANGLDYWGHQSVLSGAKAHDGSLSAYCAQNSDIPGQQYDDNMRATFSIKNGINVSGYTNVQLSFWVWYNTESGWDYLRRYYSPDGVNWTLSSTQFTGNSNGWKNYIFTLTGFTNYWIKFEFYSDGSVRNYEGAYVDEIKITGTPSLSKATELISQPEEMLAEGEVLNIFMAEKESLISIPTDFALNQNYPNPFNPETTIEYALPSAEKVEIVIYDINGNLVRKLLDGVEQTAGYHRIQWNALNDRGNRVSNGLYFYRIKAGSFSKTMKMTLIK